MSRRKSTLNATLLSACECGDPRIVARLLRGGADITTRDTFTSTTPLIKAVLGNHVNVIIVIMLLCRLNVNDFLYLLDNQGLNAFHWALHRGYIKCVSVLLFFEPSIFLRNDSRGRTCSQIVKIKCNEELINFIQYRCPQLLGMAQSTNIVIENQTTQNLSSPQSSTGTRRRMHNKEDIDVENLLPRAQSIPIMQMPFLWVWTRKSCRAVRQGILLIWREWYQQLLRLIKAPRSDHILIIPFIACVGSMAIASCLSILLPTIRLFGPSVHDPTNSPMISSSAATDSAHLSAEPAHETMSFFCLVPTPHHPVLTSLCACIAFVAQLGAWFSLYQIIYSTNRIMATSPTLCTSSYKETESQSINKSSENMFQQSPLQMSTHWVYQLPHVCRDMYSEGLCLVAEYYGVTTSLCTDYRSPTCAAFPIRGIPNHTNETNTHTDDILLSSRDLSGDVQVASTNTQASLTQTAPNMPTEDRCPIDICHICRVRLPLRAGHCKEVNTCVLGFDHYCQFLRGCICAVNYHFFIMYLACMMFAEGIFLLQGVSFVQNCTHMCTHEIRRSSSESGQHKSSSGVYNLFSRVLMIFLIWIICLGVMNLVMISYHMVLVHRGRTTREDIYRPKYLSQEGLRSPFDKGGLYANMREIIKQGMMVWDASSSNQKHLFAANMDHFSSTAENTGIMLLFHNPLENSSIMTV